MISPHPLHGKWYCQLPHPLKQWLLSILTCKTHLTLILNLNINSFTKLICKQQCILRAQTLLAHVGNGQSSNNVGLVYSRWIYMGINYQHRGIELVIQSNIGIWWICQGKRIFAHPTYYLVNTILNHIDTMAKYDCLGMKGLGFVASLYIHPSWMKGL
jgi:hypothetical protein